MNKEKKRKFISIIRWYHSQIFSFDKEQNYHMMPLEAMQELGYECEIFAIDSQVKIEDDPNFVPWVRVIYYKNIFQYLSYLWENRNALIYSNSLTIKTLLVGLIGKRTIFMAHDQVLPLESKKIKRLIVLFFYQFFSYIRVINTDEFKLLKKYNIRSFILPLALGKSFYSLWDKQREWGVFIWNLYVDKNPQMLLDTIQEVKKKYPNFILSVLGEDRYDQNGLNFQEMVKINGLEKNIKVCWFIPHKQLKNILEKSYICVNTSISEGQCLAVFEAALAGCVLCLQNILSFPSVFWDRAYYHTTAQQLANNISKALENQKATEQKVKENQEMILKHYDYAVIKKKLQEKIEFLFAYSLNRHS